MRKIIILFLLIFGTISCNTNKENTLFELLSNSKTNINFQNNLNYTEELNPYTYRNFYNGGGVGIGDFNNDSLQDIFLGFLAGFFQVGFGFIFITIGARTTPSAVVGIIMMSEAIFGPLWAWIFINEQPPLIVLIGGSIVLFAVLLQFGSKFFIKKEVN